MQMAEDKEAHLPRNSSHNLSIVQQPQAPPTAMTSNPDVPPFTGYVETTVNALRLIHAARQGVIPRITRRLNDSERRTMIKSGAVFVFSVEESGIKRWTDGLLWSPSRIVGNFLVYREINERTSSRGSHNKKPYPSDESPTRAFVRKSSPDISGGFKGHNNDQGTFKVGGLVKKTITVTIEGSDLHLISYYTSDDIRTGRLKRPSARPDIMGLYMPPEIFRLTNFRVPPKVERGPDGKPRLVSEAEDPEQVDCKVEDQGYNIPASPTWSSQSSPSSPMDAFGSSHLYSGHGNGGANGYTRGTPTERWMMGPGNSVAGPNHREIGGWSPTTSALTPSHTMSRRRDSSIMPSDSWSPINGRWQNQQHESTTPSIGTNGLYPDRSRVRSAPQYEESQVVQRRDNNDGQSPFPLRYHTPHPTTTREGALQRLHWQPREAPEHPRDLRRGGGTTQGNNSFSHSPTVPFTPQGYHTSPTYTSTWTSPDANMMATPTLHSISTQGAISYDGTYNSTSAAVPSPEGYANVEEFHDA
ncbi:Gti1/Pac2 family-domain-containing protein [Gymnopilus junonius]|uniref:Gti1/Pac2 family-domain-containing protein n=1 Tax=Gymnopilus junonius TaxID=109634 RepID=A0A9P5NT88_GYMJU|nr:Gti1/Pac2 family-domain-containing protein [Gymnopilus junonius]